MSKAPSRGRMRDHAGTWISGTLGSNQLQCGPVSEAPSLVPQFP